MMIFDITRKGFMVLIVVTIPNVIPPPPDLPPPPNGDLATTYWMTRMQGWVIILKIQIPWYCFTSQTLLQAYHHSLLFRGNQSSILFLEKITSLMGIWEKAKIAASSASSAVKIAHFFTAELQWIGFQNKKKKGSVDESLLVLKKQGWECVVFSLQKTNLRQANLPGEQLWELWQSFEILPHKCLVLLSLRSFFLRDHEQTILRKLSTICGHNL